VFRIAPTVSTPDAYTVNYTVLLENSDGSRLRWIITPSGRPPKLSLADISGFAYPSHVRVGYVEVGNTASVRVYLRNPLSQPISAITINSFVAFDTTRMLGDCAAPIAPGAQCLFATYTFAPTKVTTTSNNFFPSIGIDYLGLKTADGVIYGQIIRLDGSGGTPILGFDQPSYDFGHINVGFPPAEATAKFRNDGTAGYTFYGFEAFISQVALTGLFDLDNSRSTCQGPLVTIDPGTTCSLIVRASAMGPGAMSGTLGMPLYPAVSFGNAYGFDYYSGVSAITSLNAIAGAPGAQAVPTGGMSLLILSALSILIIAVATSNRR
jgi:hypothetical protein